MKRVAFIPVRGGSKSIPLKNIKPLAGKPLLHWVLQAAFNTPLIDEIVVATDHDEIEKTVELFLRDASSEQKPKQEPKQQVTIFHRSSDNAQDQSTTESVMLEYLEKTSSLEKEDLFILIQATNPFLRAEHLAEALHLVEEGKFDSLLSVVKTKRFFWRPDGTPLNYDFVKRPRRQDFEGLFMENGSFYINSAGNVMKDRNRLSGRIGLYEMPEISGFEIDEPSDWLICESLLKNGNL